jgi:hypothetical protein
LTSRKSHPVLDLLGQRILQRHNDLSFVVPSI